MRSTSKIAIALILWLSQNFAFARPPLFSVCLFATAQLGEKEKGDVAVATYRSLFDKLGARLDLATLRKIVEGQDPYQLPPEAESMADNLALQLTRLRGLMRQAGIDTPEVRARMLASHGVTIDAVVAQAKERKEKYGKPVEVIPLMEGKSGRLIEMGGRLVARTEEDFQGFTWRLYDSLTRSVSATKIPTHESVAITPDGKKFVSIEGQGDRIVVRQIGSRGIARDGIVIAEKEAPRPSKLFGAIPWWPIPSETRFRLVAATTDPNQIYVWMNTFEGRSILARLDLTTRKRTELDLTEAGGMPQTSWGVEGTDWLVFSRPAAGASLGVKEIFTVAPHGDTLKPFGDVYRNNALTNFKIALDGTRVVYGSDPAGKAVIAVSVAGAPSTAYFDPLAGELPFEHGIWDVGVPATGDAL